MNNSCNTVTAHNTVRSATRMMDKVIDSCTQLIGALEATKEEVTSFGTKLTDNVMKNEYVDRVLGYLEMLQKFTMDLKKHAHTHFTDGKSVKELLDQLHTYSDKLHAKMLENSFFFNHFSLRVLEITQTIKKIKDNLSVN